MVTYIYYPFPFQVICVRNYKVSRFSYVLNRIYLGVDLTERFIFRVYWEVECEFLSD